MNFSPRYVLDMLAAAALAVLAGCGEKDGSAEYAKGVERFGKKDFDGAAAEFAKCMKFAPGNVDAKLMLARTLISLGDVPGAVKAANEAVDLAPSSADAVLLAAQMAFYAHDYARSRKLYGGIFSDVSRPPETRSKGAAGLAVVDIVSISGRDMDFFRESARMELFAAIRLDPRNASARYHLGLLYRDSFGYPEPALDQFELYARLDKSDTNRVARTRAKTIPELKDSIAKNPARRAERRDSAASAKALRAAEDECAKGHFKTARLRYADALAADPLNHLAAIGLADAWYKSNPTKAGAAEAFKYARKAWVLRPGSKEMLDKAADFAVKSGNAAGAVEACSRAVAISPNDAKAIRALADAYARNGKPKPAEVCRRYAKTMESAR